MARVVPVPGLPRVAAIGGTMIGTGISITERRSLGGTPAPTPTPTPTPTVSISGAIAQQEGNSGTTAFTYTVTRSASAGAVNVPWSLTHGTTDASDFSGPLSGSVALANGVASGTFAVNVVGDTAVEGDETFTVSISAPSGYALGSPSSATGTILNDDAAAATATPTSAWAGNVSPTTATVVHRLDGDASARLVVSTASNLSSPVYSGMVASDTRTVRHKITGLSPATDYHYGIEVGGVLRTGMQGRFRTLPAAGAASFRFATGGCSDLTTSSVMAWVRTTAQPAFFVHNGDLHYGDINSTDPALYDTRLDTALSNDLGAMMRDIATFYMWDDHDFCGDNSSSASAGRATAMAVGKRRFPVDPADRWMSGADDPLGFSFVVGRVRFIVPDARSAKVTGGTVWGAAQQAIVFDQITAAKNAGQVVALVMTYPASVTEFPAAQRVTLWNHIKAEGMQASTIMLAGDAHMVAFDDGTNHNFASGGGAQVPQFVSNALSRATSIKGGPWSGGDYRQSTRQVGVVDVTDTGGASIGFALQGYRDAGVLMVTWNVSLAVPGAALPDIVPDQFTFTDVNNAALSTQYVSNAVTLEGMDAGADGAVSIVGGEYRKNGGAWTSATGTGQLGDQIEVRATSSGSNSTAVNVTLTVQGVSDTFTITTAAAAGETSTTLDPAKVVAAEASLSNGNMRATALTAGSNGSNFAHGATQGRGGLRFFSVLMETTGGNGGIGVVTPDFNFALNATAAANEPKKIIYLTNATVRRPDGGTTNVGAGTGAIGARIYCAYDTAAGLVWFGNTAAGWLNGDPQAGTGGYALPTNSGTLLAVAVTQRAAAGQRSVTFEPVGQGVVAKPARMKHYDDL